MRESFVWFTQASEPEWVEDSENEDEDEDEDEEDTDNEEESGDDADEDDVDDAEVFHSFDCMLLFSILSMPSIFVLFHFMDLAKPPSVLFLQRLVMVVLHQLKWVMLLL